MSSEDLSEVLAQASTTVTEARATAEKACPAENHGEDGGERQHGNCLTRVSIACALAVA